MDLSKEKDFVEINFSGYSNGKVFDSNIEEDLKKLNPEAKPEPLTVVIGQNMVIPGLDKALKEKEVGKEYEIEVKANDAFGERKRELVKIIPVKIFLEKNINPYPGLVLAMDQSLVKIIAVSGGRVTADFNNPLAGKDLKYKFKILRIVTDEREKADCLFKQSLRFIPEYSISDNLITVKGPKNFQVFITAAGKMFNELIGKELKLEVLESKKDEKKKDSNDSPNHNHDNHEHDN
jgi:FKBP-type peptidyl-prolyl cis-trans isomerase SlyD